MIISRCIQECPPLATLFQGLRSGLGDLIGGGNFISEDLPQFLRAITDEEAATGLLLYHKYANLPLQVRDNLLCIIGVTTTSLQLIGPLHRNLWEDVCWAKGNAVRLDMRM
jgi:hypothetical protein